MKSTVGGIRSTGRRGPERSSKDTPLITTVPYVYEAFREVHEIDGKAKWREVMHSIAQHTLKDYTDL